MVLRVSDAYVSGFRPANDGHTHLDADYVVGADSIREVSLTDRLDRAKATGRLVVENENGLWGDIIDHGDRVRFLANLDETTPGYGEGGFGEGGYGGPVHRFTGLVRNIDIDRLHDAEAVLVAELGDFVGEVMGMRRVTASYEGMPVVATFDGTEHDNAVNDILEEHCPELSRRDLVAIGGDEDLFFTATGVGEALNVAADRVGAAVFGQDDRVQFQEITAVSKSFDLTAADKTGAHRVRRVDDDLANDVRVNGGEGLALEAEATSTSTTVTVDDTTRAQTQIATRKAELTRVKVYTVPSAVAEANRGSVTVRLQKDDGGSPIAPGDSQSDIARASVGVADLADGGLTTFDMGDHTLPEPSPWLLIESSDGEMGIGAATGTSDPAFEAYFPFPVVSRKTDLDSITAYRRREDVLSDESVTSKKAASAEATDELIRRSEPATSIEFAANSDRALALNPGDIIGVSYPGDGIDADRCVVTRVEEAYLPDRLHKRIRAQTEASYLAT